MSVPALQEPAGLSSDTLEPPASSHAIQDDQWSDAHTAETDDDRDVIEEAVNHQDDLTIRPPKISNDKAHDMNAPSPNLPSPPEAQELPHEEAETGSVHSLPVVQVTEPTSPTPMTSRSASATYPSSPTSLAPTTTSSLDRRNRNRAAFDARASNRISGFFSSLIHRRDNPPAVPRESPAPDTPPVDSSRASSPLPSRTSTPPPALSAPLLNDLGLSLSCITAHLSPSHFSTPPISGAFLQPHYLLLCHAQGLDVVPLVSPPAPQPYTLIRRVPFKSVVVMEHRGVLVAIAGRRDGVRVYALEEVRRAVEWRVELEVKREREKARREEMKKVVMSNSDPREKKLLPAKEQKASKVTAFPPSTKSKLDRRASVSAGSPDTPTAHTPTPKRPKTPLPPVPSGPPPAYSAPSRTRSTGTVAINTTSRSRATSVSDVLAGTLNRLPLTDHGLHSNDAKGDWASSDDEAIDPVAAPSGSEALDERTSSVAATGTNASTPTTTSNPLLEVPTLARTLTSSTLHSRRGRPSNLDLSLTRANPPRDVIPMNAPPSPTPTLLTLRQALLASPGSTQAVPTRTSSTGEDEVHHSQEDGDGDGDGDEEDDPAPSSPTTPTRERISLAEALLESRLPDLPPLGTQQPQEAILLESTGDEDQPPTPRTTDGFSTYTRRSVGEQSARRRRRWSVLDGIFTPGSSGLPIPPVPGRDDIREDATRTQLSSSTEMIQRQPSVLARPQLSRAPPAPSLGRPGTSTRPSTAASQDTAPSAPMERASSVRSLSQTSSSGSRFLPRIITNVFARRSEDQPVSPRYSEADGRRSFNTPVTTQAPAPKLEYVKLPGTKNSIMIKAVETAKKSFLAILCGDNGEKVELFAGTYRTALGLSRTFILPDSPKSLELQLQGDDLVEVFLVFSQNVFGLEPATVRVREVRIGRAERRAARRRLREAQQIAEPDAEAAPTEEDTAVNVTIGVTVPVAPTGEDAQTSPMPSPLPGTMHPADTAAPTEASGTLISSVTNDELTTLAAAHMSSYTTFQQLTFAPKFPLATIADEYIIPPTYASFMEYKDEHEPGNEVGPTIDISQVQFSPPGLPVPVSAPPSQWFYRDPKGVIHGPWKASIMQTWYKDGLLPLDLPVRREEDDEYIMLKDLRLQAVDPSFPFRSPPVLGPPNIGASGSTPALPLVDPAKPLLSPISLLSQPRHFGPPALFFSSRGGHSTTIVDARGRSVLRGRFLWSADDEEEGSPYGMARLGDVKRLEAFDVADRAVLVAMRQGGLEVVDFGDALLQPADHSRTNFPHFHPPSSAVNRRGPFVWRIGTPLSHTASTTSLSSFPSKPLHRKKQSAGPIRASGRSDLSGSGEADAERDEVLFLGRKDNEVYICERRMGSFRILRLAPTQSVS